MPAATCDALCCAVLQGQLLQGLTSPLERVMEYEDIKTTAGKLLQYVRSMPAVTCAMVGHKVRGLCCVTWVGVVAAADEQHSRSQAEAHADAVRASMPSSGERKPSTVLLCCGDGLSLSMLSHVVMPD
jgi:hypothetical protein